MQPVIPVQQKCDAHHIAFGRIPIASSRRSTAGLVRPAKWEGAMTNLKRLMAAALVVAIGLLGLSNVVRADPLVDAFVEGFNKGKQPKPKCDIECVRNSGGSLGSVPASSWPKQLQRTAPMKPGKIGMSGQAARTSSRR
jgi:hypothetical protein